MSTLFDSKGAKNIGTSPVDVYTVPGSPASAIVQGLTISNKKANSITVTVGFFDSSAADTYLIVQAATIPVGGAIVPVDSNKVNLQSGDKIQVTASEANACDAVISFAQSS